ncbi:hypothetical protein [Shewanella baltica]|uniref:hypothetical protein n=1 Tax=Shewanella baltica TaxID=62322 RepID=UPI00217E1259|nr:hypothetical protein [Shewanella baltica]MCS6238065.1 hypothetical protein [Shewanella baltica]
MNNFFKMSLVAAAIAVSGTATAGTFAGNNTVKADVTANENAVIFSTEGFAKLTGTDLQLAPVISYKLGAAYIIGDELTFTFSAAKDAKSVLPTTIMVDTAEFNLIAQTTTTVKYRVISGSAKAASLFVVPQQKTTAADINDSAKSGLVFTAANLDGLTVAASATKNNGADVHDVDTTTTDSGAAANLLSLKTTQFGKSTVTTKLNAVVDQSAPTLGKAFVIGTDDAFTVTYKAPKVMPVKALLGADDGVNDLTAAADSVAPIMLIEATLPIADIAKYTIKSSVVGAVVSSAAGTIPANADITITYPKGTTVPSDTVTITPKTGASAPTMGAYTFAAAITANGSTPLASAAANVGAWTTAGDYVVTIPYMPFGTGLSQVIYANNKSVSDVEVSAVATDENGTVHDLGVVGTAKAASVAKLSTPIKNALEAEGFTSGKVAIEITFRGNSTDVLAGKIQVHSGYNANASDRGFVANTSNGAQ